MRRRALYISGIVLLILSATLVIWQGSFNFGDFGPNNAWQTSLFWAVSTLIFLLTVTLGFILFRTGVKLYIERQSNLAGSRIKTKMVVGALALSFIPVFFLVLWSVYVLNRNLDKWFSQPGEMATQNLSKISEALVRVAREKAQLQADWLASSPEVAAILAETAPFQYPSNHLCRERGIEAAALVRNGGAWLPLCGAEMEWKPSLGAPVARAPVRQNGATVGFVLVGAAPPAAVVAIQGQIEEYRDLYEQRRLDKTRLRNTYVLLLTLITLFVLFVATWLALFMAKQISNPISALLDAAGEVRRGNLGHRIQVRAIDEMATLVRAFNEMTGDLEANNRELERRRRFTEAILESIPTGVISIASDGTIQRCNRALLQMFPEERVRAAGRLEDLFSRDDTAEIKHMMKRARRAGRATRQLELKTPNGTLHLSATVSALEEKLTSGFVMVLEDTTDLLRAQKAAAWQEVARRVAHEIKNPLTPIALCSDRIARQLSRVKAPPEAERIIKECTTAISAEVESLRTLVNEFSQFSRFPTARPEPCDLNEVVETALASFAGRLDGIEIAVELAPGLPLVNVDREQFKRVVTNLVDNAAEAMTDAMLRRLYLGTQASGEVVELVVADTGCGISPEDKDHLFLPYFSTKGRGTGLGLAIVNHILSEHDCAIRVEDNTPAGARFIVEIPALAAAEPDARPVETQA